MSTIPLNANCSTPQASLLNFGLGCILPLHEAGEPHCLRHSTDDRCAPRGSLIASNY